MAKYVSEKVRNHIPDDLAIPILSKLPLKSLKRFGCVNKSWSILFENPNFMVEFRNNFISIPHSYYNDTSFLLHQIVCNHNHTYIGFSLHSLSGERLENKVKLDLPNPFQQEEPGFYVLVSGGITGILCLYDRDTIVMWNPTTEEFKVIPPSHVESLPPYQGILKYLHGFGYDSFSDDYKIIRKVDFVPVTDDDDDDDDILPSDVKWKDMCENYEPFWEVYSLVCNSWRKIDLVLPTCCWDGGNSNDNLLYLDGMCHWLSNSYGEYNEEYLVSFDLANEICFTTLIPTLMPLDIDPNNWVNHALVLLNGSIASILWYTNTFHISILGQLGVKESWTKIFVVGPLSDDIKFPIGAGKNGDIFFAKKVGREPICFDLCTQMIEELDGVKEAYNSKIIIYKESLVSIGGKHQ